MTEKQDSPHKTGGLRRQLEEALVRSEERYRTILEQMQDSYYEVDLAGNFMFVSDSFCANTGYSREELIGSSYRLVAADKDFKAVFLAFNRVYRTGEPNKGFVNEVIRKDGGVKHFESSIAPLRNEQGEIIGFQCVGRDMTGRKLLEEAVVKSEERYRTILDQMQDSYYELDLAGNFTFVSESAGHGLGYSREEMIGQNYRLGVPEEDSKSIFAAYNEVYRTGTPNKGFPHRIRHKDGSIIFTEVSIDLNRNNAGEITGFKCVSRDISERKRVEEALRESDAQYRLLSEHMQDTVWLMDMNRKITYQSPSVQRLRGFTPREAMELPLEKHVTPESFKLANEVLWEELSKMEAEPGYNTVRTLELEYYRKDGTTLWAENTFSILRDSNGKPVSILGEGRDITARKQMEKLLIDNEARYRSLFENNPAAVYSVDLRGRFTSVNAAAVRLTGYSEEEALGMSVTDLVAPDHLDAILSYFRDSKRGEAQSYDAAIKAKDGKRIDVHITSTPIIIDGNIVGIYGIGEDIGDRKRLEEERQRVDKLESVGLLAGGIAHDFNNILTAILGNISLARMEAAPGSELQTSLEQAEKASLRAKDLTQQLLTFSRGGAPVTKLASLTELLKDTAGFALRGTNVKCRFSIPEGLWHAEVDAGQVSQVIHNLVVNGQQAMPAGGTIEITAENMALSGTQSLGRGLPIKAGDYVRIAVADHGIGIPRDHMEKIFDPFFSTKQKGSGLGLASSFSIARNHGGHLSVESKVGAGSTFYLYLPASTKTSAPRRAKKERVKPVGKARILVMDDELGVREVAGRMLTHIGYEDIEFAADGAEAVKLYKAALKSGNPFSVVILDLTIAGGMGGEIAIRKLLKTDPGVKAIVSSGYADDPVIARYSDYGFSGRVAKPYTLEQLRKALHDVIG